MDIERKITELREETGESRKKFSVHTGIPVRTLEDWEAGRRTPPEYISRLIEYQMKYEKLVERNKYEKIHSFAVKWIEKFQDPTTNDREIEKGSFGEECFSIGFEMDCGNAFIKTFPDKNVFDDWQELYEIIDSIEDVYLLGSAIFSKWRYFNHWASDGESITDTDNRKWFIIALEKIKRLTVKNDTVKDSIKLKVQKLICIVNELEADFPDSHFTLDGHLVGSIGEVMAKYHYGIELCTASKENYDGEVEGKKVQIKITQQDNIMISSEPEYLIVLYLNKGGDIYEVYNGPGDKPWDCASKPDSHNYRHMRVNKLMELDRLVLDEERISAIRPIEKMKVEYKNKKRKKES